MMGMPPKKFVSDGCSGFMSFVWRVALKSAPPWEGCCTDHDFLYWMGGDRKQRLEADSKLMQDVAKNGHPWWAVAMFVAVRIGGMWWLPFPSLRQVNGKWRLSFNEVRWGYGWPYPQYKARNSAGQN